MANRNKQVVARLKVELECAQHELKRAEERSELRRELVGALAVFAAGLINNFDPISYKRAVEIINELQKRAA